jgi:hypothetical protein
MLIALESVGVIDFFLTKAVLGAVFSTTPFLNFTLEIKFSHISFALRKA